MSPSRATFRLPGPGGTEYRLRVQLPAASAGAKRRLWPAVLVMDGDMLFAPAAKAYRGLERRGEVPPLLMVGIGYGVGFGKPGNERLRDYTPTAVATERGSGGADAFVRFLAARVFPELERRYPADPAQRGLAGHSLGALAVLHALFSERPVIHRFLVSAPSLWWDGRAMLARIARLQDKKIPLPARLFLCSGGQDTESMTGDLVMLERQLALRPFPGLAVTSTRFPDRDHYNVLPDAYERGLTALFRPGTI